MHKKDTSLVEISEKFFGASIKRTLSAMNSGKVSKERAISFLNCVSCNKNVLIVPSRKEALPRPYITARSLALYPISARATIHHVRSWVYTIKAILLYYKSAAIDLVPLLDDQLGIFDLVNYVKCIFSLIAETKPLLENGILFTNVLPLSELIENSFEKDLQKDGRASLLEMTASKNGLSQLINHAESAGGESLALEMMIPELLDCDYITSDENRFSKAIAVLNQLGNLPSLSSIRGQIWTSESARIRLPAFNLASAEIVEIRKSEKAFVMWQSAMEEIILASQSLDDESMSFVRDFLHEAQRILRDRADAILSCANRGIFERKRVQDVFLTAAFVLAGQSLVSPLLSQPIDTFDNLLKLMGPALLTIIGTTLTSWINTRIGMRLKTSIAKHLSLFNA